MKKTGNSWEDESLQSRKDDKRERERVAAEKLREENRLAAEMQRIADGKPTVKETFHPNGQLKSRTNYQSKNEGGKRHGAAEEYHANGQLKYKGNWKDGKQEGIREYYYENGQLESRTNMKDNWPNGISESYYENGQLEYRTNWKNGKIIDQQRGD